MGHDILVVLFATACGFTASGILANLYRLIARKSEGLFSRIIYAIIMVVAGPSVLLENATASFRNKSCSSVAFWLAASLSAYWSFAIGLLVISIGLALKAS